MAPLQTLGRRPNKVKGEAQNKANKCRNKREKAHKSPSNKIHIIETTLDFRTYPTSKKGDL